VAAAAVVLGVATQVLAAVTGAWRDVLAPGPARPEDVVAGLAGAAALGLAGWLVLALAVSVAAALLPRCVPVAGIARTLAPHLLRHAVAALVSAAVIGGATPAGAVVGAAPPTAVASAQMSELGTGSPARLSHEAAAVGVTAAGVTAGGSRRAAQDDAERAAVAELDPGWRPTGADVAPGWVPTAPQARRVATSRPDPEVVVQVRRRPATAVDDEVVVRRGDTLWSIAERHLGPGSTTAEIAVEWPRWYAANRGLLGADPDRLVPGTRLRPPDSPGPEAAGPSGAPDAPAGVGAR
jgi:hypothetical protein